MEDTQDDNSIPLPCFGNGKPLMMFKSLRFSMWSYIDWLEELNRSRHEKNLPEKEPFFKADLNLSKDDYISATSPEISVKGYKRNISPSVRRTRILKSKHQDLKKSVEFAELQRIDENRRRPGKSLTRAERDLLVLYTESDVDRNDRGVENGADQRSQEGPLTYSQLLQDQSRFYAQACIDYFSPSGRRRRTASSASRLTASSASSASGTNRTASEVHRLQMNEDQRNIYAEAHRRYQDLHSAEQRAIDRVRAAFLRNDLPRLHLDSYTPPIRKPLPLKQVLAIFVALGQNKRKDSKPFYANLQN